LLTKETGWKASRSLTETIQKTVEGYRKSGWL
jgi:nucleoside-diphosphate-sugar epimerase